MQAQDGDPLIEEALRWLVVLQDSGASDADRAAFAAWLAADPRHAAAWERAERVWTRVGRFGPAFRASQGAPGRPAADAGRAGRPSGDAPAKADRRRFLQAAAAVAAVAVPAAVLVSRPGLLADHATAVGERRTVTLEDGSTVELAGSSSLSVDFSAVARRIVLHDGEAFFDVARDGTRPFEVEAADGTTRALGTAFDVKRQGSDVTVAVVEHTVQVTAGGGVAVVGQGQQVRYGARRLGRVHDADISHVEAWRRDRLIFYETPLGEVIADLERYRGGRIVMTDARLRGIPVTAVFDARQADAALDTIADSLSIRVRRLTGLLVVLSPGA